jgi:Sigma-70 region 2
MAPVVDRMESELSTGSDTLSVSGGRRRETTAPLVSRALGRARAGDRDALRFLYIRYADDVYGYARTVVCGHEQARDVTWRAFAELERLIDRYDERRDAPFSDWIRALAHDLAAGENSR